MNVTRKILIVLVLIGIYATNPFGSDASSQETGRRHHGPPAEAYTACEGKNVGDTAEFVSPRGDTVTGTCEQQGDRLVLRPDHAKARSGGRRQGPPPEAYTACEGKAVGDKAEFVSPRGDTVTGTCEEEGDRLVLRPVNPPF